MFQKLTKLLLLAGLSIVTLFIIYPLLHEFGHALSTVLLGGRIGGFSLTPLPHVESGLPYGSAPFKVAAISLSGILLPILACIPFLRLRRFAGFVVTLLLLISAITCVVELCIAIQYSAGIVVENDDIVLFLQATAPNLHFAYLYTGGLALLCFGLMLVADPFGKIEDIAQPTKSNRRYNGQHSR